MASQKYEQVVFPTKTLSKGKGNILIALYNSYCFIIPIVNPCTVWYSTICGWQSHMRRQYSVVGGCHMKEDWSRLSLPSSSLLLDHVSMALITKYRPLITQRRHVAHLKTALQGLNMPCGIPNMSNNKCPNSTSQKSLREHHHPIRQSTSTPNLQKLTFYLNVPGPWSQKERFCTVLHCFQTLQFKVTK